MKKTYLAGGISDKARKQYQKELAQRVRETGREVYAASENNSINDKSNDPTPLDIYNADIDEVLASDEFIYTMSGAGEDGTQFEGGVVTGANEERQRYNRAIHEAIAAIRSGQAFDAIDILEKELKNPIPIIAFTTNERLMQPQFFKGDKDSIVGIPSGGYNHLILGGFDKWGKFVGDEDDLMEELQC